MDIGWILFFLHLIISIRHEVWSCNPFRLFATVYLSSFIRSLTSIGGINEGLIAIGFSFLNLTFNLTDRTVFYFSMNCLRSRSSNFAIARLDSCRSRYFQASIFFHSWYLRCLPLRKYVKSSGQFILYWLCGNFNNTWNWVMMFFLFYEVAKFIIKYTFLIILLDILQLKKIISESLIESIKYFV